MGSKFKELCELVFKTPAGKDLLTELEKQYVWRRSFTLDDSLTTAFKEGQRDTAIMIIDMGRGK